MVYLRDQVYDATGRWGIVFQVDHFPSGEVIAYVVFIPGGKIAAFEPDQLRVVHRNWQ